MTGANGAGKPHMWQVAQKRHSYLDRLADDGTLIPTWLIGNNTLVIVLVDYLMG